MDVDEEEEEEDEEEELDDELMVRGHDDRVLTVLRPPCRTKSEGQKPPEHQSVRLERTREDTSQQRQARQTHEHSTMATLSRLEASSVRSLVSMPAIFTETLAAGSNTSLFSDRDLTIEEALADVRRPGGIFDYAKNCKLQFRPETIRKNQVFMKAFKNITGTTTVTVDTANTYLNCILHQQRHRMRNFLKRVMSRKSFCDNHCRLVCRIWRAQNSNTQVPGELQFACRAMQDSAKNSLPASGKTVPFCDGKQRTLHASCYVQPHF